MDQAGGQSEEQRSRFVTFGSAVRALVKYRPFLVTVVAVLLIVLLVPGRSANPSSTGTSATTTNAAQSSASVSGYGAASVGKSAALGAPNCKALGHGYWSGHFGSGAPRRRRGLGIQPGRKGRGYFRR